MAWLQDKQKECECSVDRGNFNYFYHYTIIKISMSAFNKDSLALWRSYWVPNGSVWVTQQGHQDSMLFLGPKKHQTHAPGSFPFTSSLFPEMISLHWVRSPIMNDFNREAYFLTYSPWFPWQQQHLVLPQGVYNMGLCLFV